MSQTYRNSTLVFLMSVIAALSIPAAIVHSQISTLTLESALQTSENHFGFDDDDFDQEQQSSEKSEFCRGMAELLRVALKDKNVDDIDCREAIETAMALVETNALAKSETKIAEMKIEHEKEMAKLRGRDLQLSAQLNTVDDLKQWLGPLYTNQNRVMQQIQMLSFNSNAINRTLSLLEKQLSTDDSSNSFRADDAKLYLRQIERNTEIEDLRRQVSELKKLIQPQIVRPANHLQPIFDAKQTKPASQPWPARNTWERR